MPLKIVLFEASKLVSTKTLLLKHNYRRQGCHSFLFTISLAFCWFLFPLKILAMGYTIFLGKRGKKGIHHRSGKKGIHHRASDLEKD